jgi:uncharacterized protein (DUF305 family)
MYIPDNSFHRCLDESFLNNMIRHDDMALLMNAFVD